jgi:Transposase
MTTLPKPFSMPKAASAPAAASVHVRGIIEERVQRTHSSPAAPRARKPAEQGVVASSPARLTPIRPHGTHPLREADARANPEAALSGTLFPSGACRCSGCGIKSLLLCNLQHLTPAQFAKSIETLDSDPAGQQITLAWIAKEKLRAALNLRARDRLSACCDWCARHEDIPELISLAQTISRRESEIVTAVMTGVTSATSESLNRLAKLEARLAYGFQNPANQRRRVRIACTRGYRRPSRTATPSRAQPVTGRKPDPG